MNKNKNKSLKRLLAAFLSVVVVVTGLQLGSTVEETAEAATEATITAFNGDPLPVTTFQWAYKEKFTKASVCPNGTGTSINADLIEYGGLNLIGSTANLGSEFATHKYNQNLINGVVALKSAVQASSSISVVSGLQYDSDEGDKPWVKYKNVGYVEENGEKVELDLKVQITGWEICEGTNQNYAFVEIGTCVDPDAESDSDYPNDEEAIGIWPSANVKYINLEYTFYKAGTSTEYSLDGQFSLVDLDGVQYFKIQNTGTSLLGGTSNISAVTQCVNDYLIRRYDDQKDHVTLSSSGTITTVSSSNAFVNPNDKVMIGSNTWDIDGSYKGGYVTFSFTDQSKIRFRFGNNGANNGTTNSLVHYYYGITPYSIGSYTAPTPTKQVLTDGSTLSLDNLTDSTTLRTGNREVTYVSHVVVPRSLDSTCNYDYFSFTDTLNDVFDMDETTAQIYQDSLDGSNVTSWFTDAGSGNTLTYTAARKSATITESNGRDFFGHTYYFVITTEIKEGLDDNAYEDAGVTQNNGLYTIQNTCSVTAGVYNATTGEYKEETNSSETVYVSYTQPSITLTKQVKRCGAADSAYAASATVTATGDKVHYKVVLSNTTTGSAATNVSFTDKVPANVTVDTSTLKATLSNGSSFGTTVSAYGQVTFSNNKISVGFNFNGKYKTSGNADTNSLEGGNTITLEYDAALGSTGENGAVNTATATADNDLSATASATVFNGADISWSPSIALTKKAASNYYFSKNLTYVIPNGTASYTVTATNDGDETLGTMEITDDTLPDSFTLTKIYVKYNSTGTDSNSSKYWTTVKNGENGFTISQNGNAWTVSVDDSAGGIPAGAIIRVSATYTVGEDVTDGEVYTNTAQVTGTGFYSGLAVDAEASASVTVEKPKLQVTKTSDKSSYTLGETAHYTIEVTLAEGAHGSVSVDHIYDVFDLRTSETLYPDLVDVDANGNFTGAIKNLEVSCDGYSNLQTSDCYPSGVDGAYVMQILNEDGCNYDESLNNYISDKIDPGAIGQSGYSLQVATNLNDTGKTTMIMVTYDLELTNEALVEAVNEPGTVTNTVVVTSGSVDAVYAVNTIEVQSTDTTLSIDKKVRAADSDDAYADSIEICEGEQAQYQLTITNTGRQTAENVTISDEMLTNVDNALLPDSYDDLSVILCNDEGMEVGSLDGSGEKTSCFSDEDYGWNLTDYYDLPAGYSLQITYTVSYNSNATYDNSAAASADNAESVDDSAWVLVKTPARTTINVEKKILASDVNFANGDPIFVINLTGTDTDGNSVSKHEVVQFTEDYVTKNAGSDGYVSITVTFANLLPGDYDVSEDASLRYRLKSIDGQEGADASGIVNAGANGSDEYTFVFENEKYEWQYYSETDHVVNSFHTAEE